MGGEVEYINGAPDIRRPDGTWVKYWSEVTEKGRIGYHTRGACLWRRLQARVKPGGAFQVKHPTYVGTTSHFNNFDEFMNWATAAPGYDGKDEFGRVYCLDKDILVPGNKVYSPEQCCFVPNSLNMVLTDTAAKRGAWPLGVTYHKSSQKFRSICKSKGRDVYLGSFSDPASAHAAWQRFKSEEILKLCEAWQFSTSFQQKVADALMRRVSQIKEDLSRGVETMGSEAFRGRP